MDFFAIKVESFEIKKISIYGSSGFNSNSSAIRELKIELKKFENFSLFDLTSAIKYLPLVGLSIFTFDFFFNDL